jgi:hypothetical protein
MINKVLDLPYDEPVETYSLSEHLYHDLGIPPGTAGRLPKAARTRAGLAAEEVEDLGETGRRRSRTRSPGTSEGRGRRSGHGRHRERPGRTERTERDVEPDRDAVDGVRRRRSRTRKRTRAGVPVSETGTSAEPTSA